METPIPFIFMDMNMKYCTTDYGINTESHYSQVSVLSFVKYTGAVPFNNEMTRAIIEKLF